MSRTFAGRDCSCCLGKGGTLCLLLMITVHDTFVVLLQALQSQAGTALMLHKHLSAERVETEGLGLALQCIINLLDGAQADANSFQAANKDLLSRLHSRDAEVDDLKSAAVRPTAHPDEVPLLHDTPDHDIPAGTAILDVYLIGHCLQALCTCT